MTDQIGRPQVRSTVSVDVAEAELVAVRDLLAQLEGEVAAERRAADEADRRSRVVSSALDVDLDPVEQSRRIVEEMTATRQVAWRASFEEATVAAEARVAEATRLAEELAAASRREVSEILATGWVPPAPVPSAAPASAPRHLAPAAPAAVVPASVTGPPSADEVFWREAARATAARAATTKAVAAFAPIEAILPTVALVILLIAVLLLVG